MAHFGGAGHSIEIAKRLSTKGIIIGIDRDLEAIKAARQSLAKYNNIKYVHGNHDEIKGILEKEKIEGVDRNIIGLRGIFISNRFKRTWF